MVFTPLSLAATGRYIMTAKKPSSKVKSPGRKTAAAPKAPPKSPAVGKKRRGKTAATAHLHQAVSRNIAERKQAEEALRKSEERYRALVELSPDAILVHNRDGQCIYANPAAIKLWAASDEQYLIGRNVVDLIPPDHQEHVARVMWRVLEEEGGFSGIDEKILRLNGEVVDVEVSGVSSTYQGQPAAQVVLRDVTERRAAEEALRKSEEKYRSLFEDSRDVVYRTSRDGRFLDINPAGLELFGYAREEMIGMPVNRLYAEPADRAAFLLAIENTGAVRNYELRFQRKDGTVLDCLVTATVWRDAEGRVGGFHGTIRDVTERKRAEVRFQAYHRQLRVLASQLALAEERERRRMAEGLHDHVAQSLTVAKMRLDALRESAPDGDLADRLDDARRQVEETIRQTRNLIFDFSPPVLHELGFEAALEWLVEEFQARNRLPTSFEDDGRPKPLQEPVRLTLFRASRELLANVVKHARAGHVAVRVRRDGDEICVEVEDDGVGFDPAILNNHRNDDMAFGLFSIRERLDYYGGRLDIASAPGKGTRVTLAAPVARESHEGGSP